MNIFIVFFLSTISFSLFGAHHNKSNNYQDIVDQINSLNELLVQQAVYHHIVGSIPCDLSDLEHQRLSFIAQLRKLYGKI